MIRATLKNATSTGEIVIRKIERDGDVIFGYFLVKNQQLYRVRSTSSYNITCYSGTLRIIYVWKNLYIKRCGITYHNGNLKINFKGY